MVWYMNVHLNDHLKLFMNVHKIFIECSYNRLYECLYKWFLFMNVDPNNHIHLDLIDHEIFI